MDGNWSDKLDGLYRSHQENIENELYKMVNSFEASVDESSMKENQIRLFIESLCHT